MPRNDHRPRRRGRGYRPLKLSYRDVPIFIISFNRVSCLRQLIEWLSRHGYRRMFVIDNASTYPPLWSDDQEIERAGVTVIRLGEKAGSRALWGRNVLETVGVASEFVCTDSDVVPAASCPGTVVQHLQGLLNRYPEVPKIGLALRLDSIPPRFPPPRGGAPVRGAVLAPTCPPGAGWRRKWTRRSLSAGGQPQVRPSAVSGDLAPCRVA